MRTRKALTIAALVTVAGVAAALAMPQHGEGPMGRHEMAGPGMGEPGMGPGMGPGPGMLGLPLRRLDLTAEQQAKVDAILEGERATIETLRTQLRDGEAAFRAAHPVTEFDETAIREHVAAQAKVQADLEVEVARTRAKVAALLTPEQLKTVQEMQTRMRERMQERMSRQQSQPQPADAPPATH